MNARAVAIAGAALALVTVMIVLLVSGGASPPGDLDDAPGDVVVAEGPEPPLDTSLADIVGAKVTRDGDSLVFRATMDAEIPDKVANGSLSWRWDLYVNETPAWIVSATVDVESSASVTATQSDYGAGTFDHTLPGELELNDRTLELRIKPAEIPDFPSDFAWTLGTTLDGERGDPDSALASDAAPDEGRGRLE